MRIALPAALCAVLLLASARGAADTRRIEVTAKKFEFAAAELRVRKGERVTLVLRTEDFAHGISIPDFNARADLVPGKTVELSFMPDRAGSFTILCDNFCGDEHDQMVATLIVSEG